MRKTERHILIALFSGLLPLSGCQIPPDTGATDPDRFVMETNPVWSRPHEIGKEIEEPKAKKKSHFLSNLLPDLEIDAGFPVESPLSDVIDRYGKLDDKGHWLPAIPTEKVPVKYLRSEVDWTGSEAPGTIVVETATRHLYLVLPNGRAMRYGVGIGRAGLSFRGEGMIGRKAEWPRWMPSEEMTADNPALAPFSVKFNGLVGGINNPLGARALYIHQNGRDTLYRIHGTPDWKSIGHEVSSGCVRMFNQDVIDLYDRVPDGARIIVR